MLGALLLTVLLAAAMLCYLAFDKGRLPLRAALMALLPAAAMIFGLLPCAPVSYTHLDVYKRQSSRRASARSCSSSPRSCTAV